MEDTQTVPEPVSPRLLDVNAVASILGCSQRSVYRFVDLGRLPKPIHLGRMVRWDRNTIDEWIDRGCPKVR
jgi:excisionase family DNA binding protein